MSPVRKATLARSVTTLIAACVAALAPVLYLDQAWMEAFAQPAVAPSEGWRSLLYGSHSLLDWARTPCGTVFDWTDPGSRSYSLLGLLYPFFSSKVAFAIQLAAWAAIAWAGAYQYGRRVLKVSLPASLVLATLWLTSSMHLSAYIYGPSSYAWMAALPLGLVLTRRAAQSARAFACAVLFVVLLTLEGGARVAYLVTLACGVDALLFAHGKRARAYGMLALGLGAALVAWRWMPALMRASAHQRASAMNEYVSLTTMARMLVSYEPSKDLVQQPLQWPRYVTHVGWPVVLMALAGLRRWKSRAGIGAIALLVGGALLLRGDASWSPWPWIVQRSTQGAVLVPSDARAIVLLGVLALFALGLHAWTEFLGARDRTLADRKWIGLTVMLVGAGATFDTMYVDRAIIEERTDANGDRAIERTCTSAEAPKLDNVLKSRLPTRARKAHEYPLAHEAFAVSGIAALLCVAIGLRQLVRAWRKRRAARHAAHAQDLPRTYATTPQSAAALGALVSDPYPQHAWRGSPWIEQPLAALCAMTALGALDFVVTSVRQRGQSATADHLMVAGVHLVALYAPLGLLIGLVLAALITLVRSTPGASNARAWWTANVSWKSQARSLTSTAFALVLSVAAWSLLVYRAALKLPETIHRPALAAIAIAGTALVGLIVAGILFALLSFVFRVLLAPLTRKLTVRAAILCSVALLLAPLAYFLLHLDITWSAFDPFRPLWPAAFVVFHVAAYFALRRRLAPQGAQPRAGAGLLFGATLVVLVAFSASALSFGHDSAARSVIDERSVFGRELVRTYARVGDRDRDGYSVVFGGEDCDDGNRNVHPGALDRPGDGVDADCFGGDGAREVDPPGDGAYAELPAVDRPPNIVLVTIDALRPDALGTYGAIRPVSPHIDAFARQSVVFEHAYAQSARSIRSIPAFLSGMYAAQLAYGDEFLWPTIKPENVMLPEVLQSHGYVTSAVVGTNYFHRLNGFFQGFETIDESPDFKPHHAWTFEHATQAVDRLRSQDKPWFLWVHSLNVHEPYLNDHARGTFGPPGRRNDYDTEIHRMDRAFHSFLRDIDAHGGRDNTVIIFASDHGEAFGEHGNYGHGTNLYDDELRSTLIVRAPNIAPRRATETVALFDIMPTALNFARTAVPHPLPARSLVPVMLGPDRRRDNRLVFSELVPDGVSTYDLKSVRRGPYALVWSIRDGWFRLFDSREDPLQVSSIADEHPELLDELSSALRAWVATTNRSDSRSEQIIADNRLRALPVEMTQRLDAEVPGILRVVGFDLPRREFHRGENIPFTFYYEAISDTREDYLFYIDFKPSPEMRLPAEFHGTHRPLASRYPTTQWRPGEKLRDPVNIVIPDSLQVPVELEILFHIGIGSGPVDLNTPNGRKRSFSLGTITVR